MFDARKYWNDRLGEHYNLLGVGDISLGFSYNKWSYRVTRIVLSGLLKKYLKGAVNNNVLDVGSGTGFVVELLKSHGKTVTGIDISANAVKNLNRIFPDSTFLEADIGNEQVPVGDNTFSCCTAASVLYHLVDDKTLDNALKNIYRLLQKDGIFIFSDNFIHSSAYNITHQKCRTLKEWEDLLKTNGFEILDRVPNYVLMNDPVDAKGKFYPRLWKLFTSLSRRSKVLDTVIWPALYPVELLLTSIMKESPAQEFMICRVIK